MADERSLVLQRQRQLKWKQLDWLESVLMMLCGLTLFAFSDENSNLSYDEGEPAAFASPRVIARLATVRFIWSRNGLLRQASRMINPSCCVRVGSMTTGPIPAAFRCSRT